ncbi:cobaltochelatase subunit CobN [Reinekea thalattae]|uniref:Cobaltochelatase subunit CobN n=1 Tax=Reinekea thalattae TaxID=2593301 RepID=A0A5C8Z8R8_9GAMM|nr:cobaltochelatase subunit CobN [Reinekea thalattae]TXR53643.1 cobaltochelatase subunit CobN [Reinekea thalattae]
MHLTASQPGGFNDDEGIVDLQQSPADIILLSSADSQIASLAAAAEQCAESVPSIRLGNWMQLRKPAALDLYLDKTLSHAKLVVVALLGGESYWPYGVEQLQQWAQQDNNRQLIFVPGDDAADEALFSASSVSREQAVRVWQYLRQGGVANSLQLLNYLAAEFFAAPLRWREPEVLANCMLYMPGSSNTNQQATIGEWQQRWQENANANEQPEPAKTPVVLLLFYRSHLQSANTQMFDEFVQSLEAQNLNVLPIAIHSLKDAQSMRLVNEISLKVGAKLIINTTGFASNRVGTPDLSAEPVAFDRPFVADIPVMQVVLSSSTEQDWLEQAQGLRSRDVAMQVVLPEMDGRIVSRAISFKTEAHYSEKTQTSIVRYQLHNERANFVAQLANRYARLSSQPVEQRKLAIILANYPTKDGRIGNGVGLDTPESTVMLLAAMAKAGYPIDDVPRNGTELIQQLLGSITNNPNTLHHLPCWQSLALEDYQQAFAQLPTAAQQAVVERWGAPEQDPKYRQGRLMIAGMRLGEQFIGIQPARGFNVDLLANYHDPDLVPPHSYLAFYFWLRDHYQVDAVVHMGKHGNLEWLPGKGTALSNQCWPDIALGPVPHFYPFIVNDPGEGAQAKRRTQAVIIDHLMPPMTRAEVYGDLAELEALVDEFYQAMGMDSRRENWLKEQILSKVKTSHLLEELAKPNDDDEVLEQLDAYLCDIKEAQIRHGLHVLGRLPKAEKLADTLVALMRLPRGSEPNAQGILHNLVIDFQLRASAEAELFDPLSASTKAWQGKQPELLQVVSDSHWRTEADTRERLELLALDWMERFIVEQQPMPEKLTQQFPNTYAQFGFINEVIYRALQLSVKQEIDAILRGVQGQFIEPGPSGAPTRGRLDTLPTGRNFYSVDNRAIPSQAAWAIGQKSANALIERHLQEHGDYPRSLGLSVWGTATMRTGGDDIAQAFWLMGVRPIWAQGSHRVVDFEVLPQALLQRPRVDVTLRVSGFFRDAFANVMRLFDAAVLAVSEYQESGGENCIQQNIAQRVAQLTEQGMPLEQARRQASYRVFGSKPGAYGAGLQGLIDERCWETNADLAEAYLNWGGYAYGADQPSQQGVTAPQAFQHRLSQLQVVVQNQDNREHDLLDSDDYYQFQGGMTNAVNEFSGQAPVVYHNDHSNPAEPKVRTLKEELNRVIRSRVLNPKWITAMQEHGYKGAFEMTATVDYLFAYDATTGLIDDYQYQQVAEALVFDAQNQAFMKQHNADALEEIAERLLEATQRGLWQQPGDYADQLQNLLLDIDAEQEAYGDD